MPSSRSGRDTMSQSRTSTSYSTAAAIISAADAMSLDDVLLLRTS